MAVKFNSTKISSASKFVDKYLNTIYELKDEFSEDDVQFIGELIEDIESWRMCLDELELSIKKYINSEKQNEYKIDKENKEIIIY